MSYDPIKQAITGGCYDDERDRRDMARVNRLSHRLNITVWQARKLIESHGKATDYLRNVEARYGSLEDRIEENSEPAKQLIANAMRHRPDYRPARQRWVKRRPKLTILMTEIFVVTVLVAAIAWAS